MAVEVLSPKDCLKDSLSRQSVMNFNRNPNPTCFYRSSRPQPDGKNGRPNRPNNLPRLVQKFPAPRNLVMGQVKILKQGTTTEAKLQASNAGSAPTEAESQAPCCGSRKQEPDGPGTETGSQVEQTRWPEPDCRFLLRIVIVHSLAASPPPSSLPLPSFFAKKSVATSIDAAASELLKLLRLNL